MMERAEKTGPAVEPDEPSAEEEKERLDEMLDEALEETFPASDPIAVSPRNEEAESDSEA